MTDKLLPCPFCGETDIAEIYYEQDGTLMAGCTNCSAEADTSDWNARETLTPIPYNEALEKVDKLISTQDLMSDNELAKLILAALGIEEGEDV